MQTVYEKAGLFYLGKEVDKEQGDVTEVLTLLKNKNLTTHAAIIGMTGSGKTGLGIGLLEEAAIDNIPAIVIDPKGDMGDLCLTDPAFDPQHFLPWVKDEAEAKGEEPLVYAETVARRWKEGIESWGQSSERVKRFSRVKRLIYTPGSSSGIPVNILASMGVPPDEIMQDSDLFSSYLKSTATSLLALIGEATDALDSPSYILIAQILKQAWLAGEDMGIEKMVGAIISPSFKSVGVLSLEDFFPKEKRFKLATQFNALLASPSFSLWLQGEPLDIQKLLYDDEGKAKISIFSISHLNDEERMFFVTLLLNKYIAWMRRQSGASRLKAMLYMDEIFGFFPPTKNPPSKEPMLLLLKQARAFGTGIVLSTQNPVDLDYKGLANIGTWFIGRLQTRQDIDRVIEGLGGKIGSSFETKEIRALLSSLRQRTFFLKSTHLEDIRLFTTRWVMSYLKGPLKRDEISELMADEKMDIDSKTNVSGSARQSVVHTKATLQQIDSSIAQYYEPDISGNNDFYATLGAKVTIHFFNQRRGIDEQKMLIVSLPLTEEMQRIEWGEAQEDENDFERFPHNAPKDAHFAMLPEIILRDKGLRHAIRELKAHLYQTQSLQLWKCPALKMASHPGDSKADFMVEIEDALQEKKEAEIEKLKERYGKKEKVLLDRLQRAKERVEKENADTVNSLIETGISVLGALFGKRSVTKIGRAVNKGGKILKERADMSRAEARVASIQDDIDALEEELESKIDQLNERYDVNSYSVEPLIIKPRRTDIDVMNCALVWRV